MCAFLMHIPSSLELFYISHKDFQSEMDSVLLAVLRIDCKRGIFYVELEAQQNSSP